MRLPPQQDGFWIPSHGAALGNTLPVTVSMGGGLQCGHLEPLEIPMLKLNLKMRVLEGGALAKLLGRKKGL